MGEHAEKSPHEKAIEAAVQAVLEERGFKYVLDPMEAGQDAYDIVEQTRIEVIKGNAAYLTSAIKSGWELKPRNIAGFINNGIIIPQKWHNAFDAAPRFEAVP